MPTSSRLSPSLAVALALSVALLWLIGTLAALPVAASSTAATPIPGFDASQLIDTGLTDNATAYNGDTITYVLTLSNTGALSITDLVLLDFLPDTVQDIHVLNESTIAVTCDTAATTCERALVSKAFPEPLGGTLIVSATTWITWRVPSLLPGASTTLTISGRVEGQADGSVFVNRAFVDFKQGGQPQAYTFDEVATTARLRVSTGNNIVSQTPNWFSSDLGGTLSQDWGDFDRDGYLDLVLGSSLGPTIYRNDQGRLIKFAGLESTRPAYGVRWADVTGDGRLELITVGDSADGTPSGVGINRVYANLNGVFSETNVFTSENQLVRVIAVNFNPAVTTTLDLIASTNSINAACPVQRFRNDLAGRFTPAECVSTDATAALSAGDFNNDGLPDLVLGRFPNAVRLLINHDGVLTQTNTVTQTNSVTIDTSPFLPYDFAWGDYDGDGYLDLAAAFPLQRQARIYRNLGGSAAQPFQLSGIIATKRFMTPLAVDWGDFSGSGRLDLLVADDPPKIYLNPDGTLGARSPSLSAGQPRTQGAVWSARAVALDNQSLSLALSNQTGPSLLYQTLPAHLQPTLNVITGAAAANSAAWGDANGDGLNDLILGAGASNVPTKLYLNDSGTFSVANQQSFFPSGFGPHSTAYGDFNGDGNLEVLIGTGNSRFIDTYLVSSTLQRTASIPVSAPVNIVTLGDANDDGYLDLLVGTSNGPTLLYRNTDGVLDTTPIWTSDFTGTVRSAAWLDFDGDRYMDFAVGHDQGPVLIYRNNHDETFTPVFTSTLISRTTSVAWGDYNRDGYPDLAVGTYGEGNLLYDNISGTFSATPIQLSALLSKTTSLAWGDWNNDGQLDLAVGNDGEPNQVYANLGSQPGAARLFPIWQSAETGATTEVAWGDANRDGYLDLAVARQSGPQGVYRNTSIAPSHLADVFTPTLPLPVMPSYVSIPRPGTTRDAYLYSTSELLSGRFAPTVTIHYNVFNPNGTRLIAGSNITGTAITNTVFEYSVDGGSHWLAATGVPTAPQPITHTTRLGAPGIFVWNAQKDQAISDNVLFRVRVIDVSPAGPVQRAGGVAVSPPFRVRGLTCVWPADPAFITEPSPFIVAGKPVKFIGTIGDGSGLITYTWDFGDGVIGIGQTITHTFNSEQVYTVTLTVTGEPCPIVRPVTLTQAITIGLPRKTYLPLVTKSPTPTLHIALEPIGTLWQDLIDLLPAATPQPIEPAASTANTGPAFIDLTAGITSALTTSPLGYNSQPALNADGTRIAYWSTSDLANSGSLRNLDGNVELFAASINRASGEVTYTQITSSTGSILGGFNFGPSIDDAGEHIAFFSDRDLTGGNPDRNFEIFLAQIDAANRFTVTQLTATTDGINIFPSISADGRRIAFTSDRDLTGGNPDLNPEIFIVDLDAAGQPIGYTQITTTGAEVFNDQPALDSDGGHLTFISDEPDAFVPGSSGNTDRVQEVFMADLTTSGVITYTRVTTSALGTVHDRPMISPSGPDHILSFMTGDNVNRAVQSVRVQAAGVIVPIAVPGQNREQPALNRRDGTRVAVVSSDGTQVEVLDTVNLETTRVVNAADANTTVPALSADGMHVAYVSNRQIYVAYYPIVTVLIGKEVSPRSVPQQDGAVLYTIRVTNTSAITAPALVVSDTLPDKLQALAPPGDQTDDLTDTLGFGGGTLNQNGIIWDGTNNLLSMSSSGFMPWPLPAGGTANGWFNMTDNVLLMPFNSLSANPEFPDASGAGNHGRCTTCPFLMPSNLGNGAALFNSLLSQSVVVSSSAQLNFDQNTSFTLMGWFDFSTDLYVMLAKHDLNGGYIVYQSGGQPIVLVNGTQVAGSALSGWHHMAVVGHRATSTLNLYIDGQRVASQPFTGNLVNNADLTLGQWIGAYYYTGGMDDVAILRRALSAADLKRVYDWQVQTFEATYFDSRRMDGYFSTSWNQLSWIAGRPMDKELPGLTSTAELSIYPQGGADMTGNVLLLHLNDSATNSFADSSGSALNGTCSGSLCPTVTTGKFNTARYFNGSQVINLNGASLPQPWTAEFWIKRQDSLNVSAALLDGPGASLRLEQYNGHPWVGFTEYGIADWFFAPLYSVPFDQWVHLVFVADGGKIELYADGVLKAALGSNSALPLGSLGGRNGGAEAIRGALDEVAVYSRTLSVTEIHDHFLRGKLRLQFQVRACATDPCASSIPFVGPNGQSDTFFSELNNPTGLTPTLPITLSAAQYFQYRVYYEREVRNFGSPTLRSVTAGPPHIKASPSQGQCSGSRQITCALGDLGPGATAQILIKLDVQPDQVGDINNVAELQTLAANHAPSRFAQANASINAQYDLSITVPSALPTLVAGRPVTYTLVVTNAGPNAASGVTVSDTLPASLTLQTVSGSAGVNCGLPSTVLCLSSTALAANGRITVTAVANVDANLRGQIVNTAETYAQGVTQDANPLNDRIAITSTVVGEANLALSKTGALAVIAGQRLTYTLTLRNAGPSAATNVLLTDTLPASLSYIAADSSPECAEQAAGVICSIGTLGVNASHPITLVTRVRPDTRTQVNNSARTDGAEFDPNTANNTATAQTNVTARANLVVSKHGTPADTVALGDVLTYTIGVTNTGPSSALAVTLLDPLPRGAKFKSASSGCLTQTITITPTGRAGRPYTTTQVSCALGALNPIGDPAPNSTFVTVAVTVSAGVGGSLVNTAQITATEALITATATTTQTVLNANANLSIAKSASPDPVTAGRGVTYTLTITNAGPFSADEPIVTDTLPAGVAFTNEITPSSVFSLTSLVNDQIVWSAPFLDAGEVTSITFAASIDPAVTAPSLSNTAVITSGTPDLNEADNSAQAASPITTTANLAIGQRGPSTVVAGTSLTYTLVITNNGPSDAQNVRITDILSEGLSYQMSSLQSDFNVIGLTLNGQTVMWEVGSVPAHATGLLTFTADVTNTLPRGALILNRASIAADTADADPANNHASLTTTTTVAASLQVQKATEPVNAAAVAGQALTYRLNVRNFGPSQATSVVLTDALPNGLTFVSASPGCTNSGTMVTCNLGALGTTNPLDRQTLDITVNLTQSLPAGTLIQNTAYVTATEASAVASGSTANTVTTSADLSLSKARSANPIVLNAVLTYTLTYNNAGPSNAASVLITDTLPISLTLGGVASTNPALGAPAINGRNITWNAGTLAVGASGSIVFTATVNSAPSGNDLINTATIGSPTSDPSTGNNTATNTGTIAQIIRWLVAVNGWLSRLIG